MSAPSPEWINTSDLENWKMIGGGGFGKIYKARHVVWCCDVAIKHLRHDDGNGSSLLREVRMMHQGSNPHVIRVFGIVNVPSLICAGSLGLVMEFMERGSLECVQKALQGPPPWPLLFRLAHQVALGMNFLHSRTPAVLHLDLKPSNVLLDSYLNVKLTDFGLAKTDSSPVRLRDSEQEVGTTSFMPPEAFYASYIPSRATDIYSYGILLWCISTGKLPYGRVTSTMVRFRIPKGDRPLLDEIDSHDVLAELKELMTRCWMASPEQRPSSHNCTTQTEKLYEKHKHDIDNAVHDVLVKLGRIKKEKEAECEERSHCSQCSGSGSTRDKSANSYSDVLTGPPPVQEIAGALGGIQLRDDGSPAGRARESPRSCPVKPSSVRPLESPASSSGESPPASRGKQHGKPGEYQHQLSSPTPSASCSSSVQINIYSSDVRGFQQGDYNTMSIVNGEPAERRRHRTAPSAFGRQSEAREFTRHACVCQ